MRNSNSFFKLIIVALLIYPTYFQSMEEREKTTPPPTEKVFFLGTFSRSSEVKPQEKEKKVDQYQEELNNKFINAVTQENDVQKAAQLLCWGADINVNVKDENLPVLAYIVKRANNEQELMSTIKFFLSYLTVDSKIQTTIIEQANMKGYKDLATVATTQPTLNKQLIDCVQRHKDCIPPVRELIQSGADIRSKTERGSTVLHIAAAEWNDPHAIHSLLDLGADPALEDNNHRTALFFVEQRLPFIQNMERTKPALSNRQLIYKLEQIMRVLKGLAILPEPTFKLHKAIKHNNMPLVIELLKKAEDVNQRNKSDMTPLHVAVKAGNLPAVQELLNKNADVTLHYGRNITPLILAVSVPQPQIEIIEAIIVHGANTDSLDLNKLKLTKEIKKKIQTIIAQRKVQPSTPVTADRRPPTTPAHQNQEPQGFTQWVASGGVSRWLYNLGERIQPSRASVQRLNEDLMRHGMATVPLPKENSPHY